MTETDARPGCLGRLLSLIGIKPKSPDKPQPEALPYKTRDDFLSPGEASLFRMISSSLQGRAIAFAKVRLADIFFVPRPNENLPYFNRIAQRHVDFLICDLTSLRPLAGIELDDASHSRANRQESDRFLDDVFSAAGLKLIRIPAKGSYTAADVNGFLSTVPPAAAVQSLHQPAVESTPPQCPKCGIPMVVRTVSQGQHKGKRFYGCRNFPQCRQVIAIDR